MGEYCTEIDMGASCPTSAPAAKKAEARGRLDSRRRPPSGRLAGMEPAFTYESAAGLLPEARRRIAEVAESSARLQRLAIAIRTGDAEEGDVPRAKALEARLDDELGWFRDHGVQVKGIAPALLDFPARAVVDGREQVVLLCWREGEDALAWYHPVETGYLGRAPIAELDEV
jgi:hypothetical protein